LAVIQKKETRRLSKKIILAGLIPGGTYWFDMILNFSGLEDSTF
jgi:hypothetical protein